MLVYSRISTLTRLAYELAAHTKLVIPAQPNLIRIDFFDGHNNTGNHGGQTRWYALYAG